jgi:lipopolysaccharide export system permease protein
LTWLELEARKAEKLEEYETCNSRAMKVAEDLKGLSPGSDTYKNFQVEYQNQSVAAREHMKMILNINSEFQLRPALAFGCLCFVLIGAPVGIWANRADYLSVFMVCFLPTVFLYYPLMMSGTKFAKDGRLPTIPAVWLANGILFTISLGLIYRLSKK